MRSSDDGRKDITLVDAPREIADDAATEASEPAPATERPRTKRPPKPRTSAAPASKAAPRTSKAPRSSATPPPPRASKAPGASKKAGSKTPAPPKAKRARTGKTPAPPAVEATTKLDEGAERFFAQGEASAPIEPAASAATNVSMSDMPPAGLPRRNLAKYVKAAVGFCAVLLVVAGVRAALTKATHSEPVASAATAAPPPAPTVAPPPAPPDPPAAAAPATAPAPVAQVDTAAAPPPVSDKTAAQELKDAQSLLDRGKIKDAAAAAQRSIALDPTDANAWLVLGAADQMLGKGKDAHDAFTECTKQAKKGEIRECRAMLTWNGPR